MSFCSQCGKPVSEGSKFCNSCGANIDSVTQKENKFNLKTPMLDEKIPFYKRNISPKIGCLSLLLFIFIMLIIAVPSLNRINDKQNSDSINASATHSDPSTAVEQKSPQEEAIANLALGKITIKESLDISKMSNVVEVLQTATNFKTCAGSLMNAFEKGDPTTSKEAKKLLRDLSLKQTKTFPKLRRRYVAILKKSLWENDIEVKCYKKDCSTIDFTGYIFAANKNILDIGVAYDSSFERLRFQRVNYRWNAYADEYTYVTLDNPKDSFISARLKKMGIQ